MERVVKGRVHYLNTFAIMSAFWALPQISPPFFRLAYIVLLLCLAWSLLSFVFVYFHIAVLNASLHCLP